MYKAYCENFYTVITTNLIFFFNYVINFSIRTFDTVKLNFISKFYTSANFFFIWLLVFIMSPIFCGQFVSWPKLFIQNFFYSALKSNIFSYTFLRQAIVSLYIECFPVFLTFLITYNGLVCFIINWFIKLFNNFKKDIRGLYYVLFPNIYKVYRSASKRTLLFINFLVVYVRDSFFFDIFLNFFFKTSWNSYVSSFYNSIKTFLVSISLSLFLVILLIDYYNINLVRQLAAWAIVGLLFFWLMSGFNFFLKRYRFGKFTSAIQRFWKRTNTYFWMIEGFLFCLFFYYYINSSQEVYYFFDESNLNQNLLTSLTSFYISNILLVFLIMYSFFLLMTLPTLTYQQQILHLKIVTILMVYIFLLECYQFYYVITLFSEIIWEFDNSSNLWNINWRNPKIRVKTQYLILALIAKYWHFLFIFFSWLFLVLKSFEQKRIHYTLFGVNLQNCILLFILNILFNINWIRWLFRRFYDTTYYWFFIDFNNWSSETFLAEFSIFFSNF